LCDKKPRSKQHWKGIHRGPKHTPSSTQNQQWVIFPSFLTLTISNNFIAINDKYLCDYCGMDVVKNIWGK